MKRNYVIFAICFLLFPIICFAQPSANTDYFKSAATGDWALLATWQSSHDDITYFPATLIPASTATNILIQNLHTVTISIAGISLKNTTIQTGGTLQLTLTATYTIGGAGDNLVIENGGILLLNFTTLSAPSGSGTALIKTGGKVIANAAGSAAAADAIGDNYLNVNSKFTYQDKSVFEWNIANYIFNKTGAQDYFKTPLTTDIPILRISTAPVAAFGTSSSNILNCILEVNAPFNIGGNGSKTFRGGLTGTSIINQTAGNIVLPNSTSVLDGSLTINTISSGLDFTNGAIVPVGANVKITVLAENDNISKQAGNLQVNGTLDITNCRIKNTGASASVTIANGGVLKTSNSKGFSGGGSAIVAEPIILEANSTIEFNRVGDQNFNARADFKNLIFSESGIKKPGNSFAPVGTVKITGTAILDCTGHNVGDGTTNANLTMDGGRLIVSTGGVQPMMGGVYNLTGGVVEFVGSSSKSIRSKTYQNIEVSGSDVNNSSSNIVLNNLGTFTLKNGGVFTINDNGISGPAGTQTVMVESGGTFNTGNNEGFHGFTATFTNNSSIHSNIENIILNTGSNVNYSRDNNQPITNANGLSYQHLVISGIAGIKTAPSGILTISGNLTKSGNSNFAHNNGTVVFTNTVTGQDYICTSTVPVNFYNLHINNTSTGVNIVNNVGIVNTLALLDNSKLNCTIGNITLLSTAANTARVAEIPASASINYGSGRFYVERFFPNSNPVSHRAWRLVTAPLNEATDIYDTWQLGGAVYAPTNYHRGTLITGPQIAGNGLDITPTNNYSLKKYDGTNFINVANTHVPLSPAIGTGYLLFVRGDRNPILTNIANSDYTTLSCSGKIQTGPVNISLPYTYGLAGNPYPSPIDFNLIDKTDNIFPHRFYVFDPTINQVGAYVTVEDFATPGIFIPTAPYGGSSQNNYIQSSQAFFVQRILPASASITFRESNKASAYNPSIFRPAEGLGGEGEFIRTSLHLLNNDSSTSIADGNMAEFGDAYSNDVDINDALKFGNVNETFSLVRNSKKLAVERRPFIAESDTIFYFLTHATQRNYQFQFIVNITANGLQGYLEDSYTKSSAMVNLVGNTNINFTVTEDTASASPNRFNLIFKKHVAPLPVIFKTFKATRQNNAIAVEWETENEWNTNKYEIEKSVDGEYFTRVHATIAIATTGSAKYQWLDLNPLPGFNFYRIKSIGILGDETYSQIVKIVFANEATTVTIYPNPVTDGTINLQLINQPAGKYQLRLLNNMGQAIHTQTINHAGGNLASTIKPVTEKLANGAYHVELIFPDKTQQSIKVLVQTK